ncbi:MAG: xanthine dehydrogenase accessory protein XdhC [Curvibacter lanceolatus]|uniref:xanthine dehydrogenase accessory protein XdhC n=1 Tax=Curvibacter lanceolatus TaxID=86182 RepID=UPI0003771AAC|nr:xanthine dehydrogenase accessory protein XdhC [Curvibacter lanceolatus]MBV5294785.1 xanthine dehydrogenase accessory protein XdhC [Curvibacter lanceolatus]
MSALSQLLQRLNDEPACLVRVVRTQGSVPREVGAWMAVWPESVLGTIGGGHLELVATLAAREGLRDPATPWPQQQRHALGPSLGQCCGGVVHLSLERVTAADRERLRTELAQGGQPLALFGGGHVGHALVRVLAPLPFRLRWIDSRDGIFPPELPENVEAEHSDPVQGAVADLVPGSQVLVMSFSHAEDLDIVAACLRRQRERGDLPFVGLIGSQTKWATFQRRLQERGFTAEELDHITCPIGVPGISGKQPEVIAVAVAAQLLQKLPGTGAASGKP